MFKNSNLAILFFTMVVVMLGFGIIIPIMPFYIERFGAGGKELGLMMAIFSIMQFLFSPIWGDLSDRYGRKPILLLGAFGNTISMVLFAAAPNMGWMFASRALAGILSSATMPTAMAFISDSTSEKERGGGMGLIGAAMGMGMVLGPGLGGWMGSVSMSAPFYLAAGLSALAMVLIFLILPESLPKAKRITAGGKIRGPQLRPMWQALFGPMGFLLFLAFLVNFGLANFEGIFGLYSKARYQYGPSEVGTIMTVIGVVSVIIQGALTGPATRKLGEVNVILLSLLGSAVGFALMLFAEQFAVVLLTVGFFVFTNAMLRPVIASLTSKMTQGGQGMALGLNNAFQSLGRVVGPLWAGFFFDWNINLPYSTAAVIMLVSFGMGLYWLRRGEVRVAGAPERPAMEAAASQTPGD
jgi:DHA1 family multidrug resistance protein-like MFS transporter